MTQAHDRASEPIADTPMVVTLDQLHPYDHDPRVARNPAYAEIKASIRARGLDAPPAITRRPGEEHFIIRNGGNTRLAILRELWSETGDERFCRIACLFRPWPERGEIIALTGHLAENLLRGKLTFIERALGVEKARAFYQQDSGAALSQSELARRLTADGCPVPQSHISRMQDAVRYLLPAIPNILYGGLGRHQVERLAVLRSAAERLWERHAGSRKTAIGFEAFFQDALTPFDAQPEPFSVQRVQDELTGRMAERLGIGYDLLQLDLNEIESRQRALVTEPAAGAPPDTVSARWSCPTADAASSDSGQTESPDRQETQDLRLQEPIVSPAPATGRLQSMECMAPEQLGEAAPERLRMHIGQFAHEIAGESALGNAMATCAEGIGFVCATPLPADASRRARAVWTLLACLSGQGGMAGADRQRLAADLPVLLHGWRDPASRLSDTALVKLFGLLRLARRLSDLEFGAGQNPA